MERIPHRQLRNNGSDILRRVADGESFEITNHGVLDIERAATRRGGWSQPPKHRLSRPSIEMLDELREERL